MSSHWLINESSFDWSKLNLLHLHRAPRTWQDRTREFDKQEKNPYRTKRKTDKLVPDWKRYDSSSLRHFYDIQQLVFVGIFLNRKLTFWLIQFDRTGGVFNILNKRNQNMVKSDHSRCYIYSEVKSHSLSVNFSLLGLDDYNSMELVWYTL